MTPVYVCVSIRYVPSNKKLFVVTNAKNTNMGLIAWLVGMYVVYVCYIASFLIKLLLHWMKTTAAVLLLLVVTPPGLGWMKKKKLKVLGFPAGAVFVFSVLGGRLAPGGIRLTRSRLTRSRLTRSILTRSR